MAGSSRGRDRNLFGGGGRSEADEATDRRRTDKELSLELETLEKDIDELRATYELFFMGVDKVEPSPQRDLIKARLRRLRERKVQNTASKFRIQQLKARMVSLENYWQRTLRQREAGTYHRDIARVRRREAERQAQALRAAGADGAPPAPEVAAGHDHPPATRSLPAQEGGSRPRVFSSVDLTEDRLKHLYNTYLGARRRCGESTDLRFDDMAATLRRQVPKLMAKTGADSVEFKVVIRGGKAVLKALPRGGSAST